jgi:hypothetical protein
MSNDPGWRELERVLPLEEAEELTSLSRWTLVRRYPQYVVRVSPARLGIKYKHALAITGQTLASISGARKHSPNRQQEKQR